MKFDRLDLQVVVGIAAWLALLVLAAATLGLAVRVFVLVSGLGGS